jgi:hypothetical protein
LKRVRGPSIIRIITTQSSSKILRGRQIKEV